MTAMSRSIGGDPSWLEFASDASFNECVTTLRVLSGSDTVWSLARGIERSLVDERVRHGGCGSGDWLARAWRHSRPRGG
jgi:hypothetical protein